MPLDAGETWPSSKVEHAEGLCAGGGAGTRYVRLAAHPPNRWLLCRRVGARVTPEVAGGCQWQCSFLSPAGFGCAGIFYGHSCFRPQPRTITHDHPIRKPRHACAVDRLFQSSPAELPAERQMRARRMSGFIRGQLLPVAEPVGPTDPARCTPSPLKRQAMAAHQCLPSQKNRPPSGAPNRVPAQWTHSPAGQVQKDANLRAPSCWWRSMKP